MKVIFNKHLPIVALASVVSSLGCGSSEPAEDVRVPATYAFASRATAGASSVAYTGQTLRHVLLRAIDGFIDGLTATIDSGTFKPEPGDVRAVLESYYAFDSSVSGGDALPLETSLPLVQGSFDALASGKDLKGKFVGNGGPAEHKDWKQALRGYGGVTSAEALLFMLFDELDALAVARGRGEYEIDGTYPVFVTAGGRDLREFIGKLLMMGTAYSQATDKYLDDELEAAANTPAGDEGTKEPFTALEHAWDEAFGYLGAARDYASYTDEELASATGSYKDSNGDGKIDVTAEMNFGQAIYAGKRDLGSRDATDFTSDLWTSFLTGRAIIAQAGPSLRDSERKALRQQRDVAVAAWENVIAASIVHYLNETIASLGSASTGEFDLRALAEPFSELKAFSLGLQFNPRSRLSGEVFDAFHAALGDAPVLPDAGPAQLAAYQARLLEARGMLQKAYGFSDANVGDDTGQGGW